jgi:hypothetical protein
LGDKKGLAGGPKGMVVGGTGVVRIHAGRLDVPGRSRVDNSVVIAFVAGTSSWTKGMTGDILLLDTLGGVAIDWGYRGRAIAGRSIGTLRPGMTRLVGRRHGGVERSEIPHHAFILILLVGMNRLRMLTEIVEARELLAAVAGEWAFASVLAGWIVRERREVDRIATNRICLARCSLRLKTMRHSPYPLHWKVLAGAGR